MSQPSLVSRFTSWVRRQPFPARTFYFGLFVAGLLYSTVARSIAGVLPTGKWTGYDVYDLISGSLITMLILAFYYYLDAEIAEVGVISATAAIQAAIENYGFPAVQSSNVLILIEWALTAIITFGFAYRVIRLIALAGRFFSSSIHLSIYNLPPIYEIPTVVGKAGLFLLVLWYLNLPLNLNEQVLESPVAVVVSVVIALVPLAAFLIPHAVIGRRLAREKTNLVVDVSQQLEASFAKLKQALESDNFDRVEPLQAAIDTLISEKRFIESIPTWPWRLGTFRVAVTAVLLPVIVWLIQQLLDRVLGL